MLSYNQARSRFSRVNSRQRGLTLIELMIAMVISLLIMAGVINVMVDNKRAIGDQQSMGFIQENARFALDIMARDIRMAGYMGCSMAADVANTLKSSAGGFASGVGIEGFDSTTQSSTATGNEWPAAFKAEALAGTDALIIRRGDTDNSFVVKKHNGASAVIDLINDHPYKPGTVMILADANCRQVGIFAQSGPTNNNGNADNVVHNKGNGSSDNCTKMLSGTFDCSSCNSSGNNCGPTSSNASYGAGSSLMVFSGNAYYVANSLVDNTVPALFRRNLTNSDGTTARDELITGVENLQLLYGVDTDSNYPDGTVDRYYDASQITVDKADAASGWVGWDRVASVRMTLVFRSFSPVYSANTAVDFGNGLSYNDRFMRQVLTSTVQIRNSGI